MDYRDDFASRRGNNAGIMTDEAWQNQPIGHLKMAGNLI